MAHFFAFYSVLLVSEFQASVADALDDVRVIQRCCWRVVDSAIYGEVDVSVAEGLGSSVGILGGGVLRWSQ